MKRWKIDGLMRRSRFAVASALLLATIAVSSPNLGRAAGEYRRDGVGSPFFIDPKDDMFAIMMMPSPSQRGRTETELKTLIYQALRK